MRAEDRSRNDAVRQPETKALAYAKVGATGVQFRKQSAALVLFGRACLEWLTGQYCERYQVNPSK